tara:strand:- start:2440 stop:3159 length:720 start_codon:yes stop_codon:yes gene_type:complete
MTEEKFSIEQPTKFSMIPEWLLDIDLTPGAYMVYGTLAKYANNQTKETFISHTTIAERLGITRATVIRRMTELEQKGCIVVQRRYEDGHQKSNNYILQWTPPSYYVNNTISQEIEVEKSFEDNSFSLDVDIKKKKTTVVEPLWRPMIEICGYDPTENQEMIGAWRVGIKQLNDKKATPEQLWEKAKAYKIRFPNAELTPKALAKWWEALDSQQPNSTAYAVTELEKRKQQIRAKNKTNS